MDNLVPSFDAMLHVLQQQRQAFLSESPVTASVRRDRIRRAIALLVDHQHRIAEAVSADFGIRPEALTRFVDVATTVHQLKHALHRVRRWMRPERRRADFGAGWLGSRARVHYQPKGVVGIISPWNFPVYLVFGPMAGALAAGNRVMAKTSEHTPATSELLAGLVPKAFDPSEVAIFTGGPETAQAFSRLPFDHLIFTGPTAVGRKVMAAAAENLTPVTLELGGKSPVIVGRSADFERVAGALALGKLVNAGQICVCPDYALVPRERLEEVAEGVARAAAAMCPGLPWDPAYTSIISERHRQRLESLLDEARKKGCRLRIVENPEAKEPSREGDRRMPLVVVLEPGDDLALMNQEIFGPILPLKGYDDLEEAIAYINARPRPLCLYYFGRDRRECRRVLDRTCSGGVTINDVIMHVVMESLPFGGIGPSGMGAYHGREGFLAFSHARAVFSAPPTNLWRLLGLVPPFGRRLESVLRLLVRK